MGAREGEVCRGQSSVTSVLTWQREGMSWLSEEDGHPLDAASCSSLRGRDVEPEEGKGHLDRHCSVGSQKSLSSPILVSWTYRQGH